MRWIGNKQKVYRSRAIHHMDIVFFECHFSVSLPSSSSEVSLNAFFCSLFSFHLENFAFISMSEEEKFVLWKMGGKGKRFLWNEIEKKVFYLLWITKFSMKWFKRKTKLFHENQISVVNSNFISNFQNFSLPREFDFTPKTLKTCRLSEKLESKFLCTHRKREATLYRK